MIGRIAALMAAALLACEANAETVAVTNGRLLTMGPAGEVANGSVVIRDGKIIAVGPSLAIPPGARVVDAGGRIVTPGFVALDTDLTITEVNGVEETNDSATSNDRISAAYDVQYAVNGGSPLVVTARLSGMTRAVVTPAYEHEAGRELAFAGLGAIVRLESDDPVATPRAVMVIDLGQAGAANTGGGRASTIVALKDAFAEARAFARNRDGFERGASRPFHLSPADLEALAPVVAGKIPLLARVHRAADIRNALRLAREEKIWLILQGAKEGWLVAGEIAAAGVPVIVDPQANLPTSFDLLRSRIDNVVRLDAAGVVVAIQGSRDWGLLRQARLNAGTAVSYGLPYARALSALTTTPAKIFGQETVFGAIAPGLDADLVIWDGDPLETTSAPVLMMVRGREQSLRSRSIRLRDRYLATDATYPPAYH